MKIWFSFSLLPALVSVCMCLLSKGFKIKTGPTLSTSILKSVSTCVQLDLNQFKISRQFIIAFMYKCVSLYLLSHCYTLHMCLCRRRLALASFHALCVCMCACYCRCMSVLSIECEFQRDSDC